MTETQEQQTLELAVKTVRDYASRIKFAFGANSDAILLDSLEIVCLAALRASQVQTETTPGRSLASYRPQHDDNCASRLCTICSGTTRFHREVLSVLDNPHSFTPCGCTCGIDQAVADLAALRQEQERLTKERDRFEGLWVDQRIRAETAESTFAALPQEIDTVIHAIPFGFAESAHTAVEHIRGRLRSFWREKGL